MAADYKMIGADGHEYEGSLEELRQWASDGRLGHESLVWNGEEKRWLRASERHELRWDLPKAVETPPVIPEVPAAGFVPRLAALLFDLMLLNLLWTLVLSPWRGEMADLLAKLQAQKALMDADPTISTDSDLMILTLKVLLIMMAAWVPVSLIYWVGFNGRFGATPGKSLVGLKIVAKDGSPLGYARAFRRYCAEQVSTVALGLGYLMVAFSPNREALHDVLAGTKVIFHRRQ